MNMSITAEQHSKTFVYKRYLPLICSSALAFSGFYDCLLPLFLFLIILVDCLDFAKEM
jgi:hypothetical protein